MLNVYRCLSENISVAIAENGEIVTKQPLIRAMRTVKTETLRLISTWVSKSNDAKLVCDNFIPPLLDAVLGDYQRNVPNAREPEVLSTMATFVNKLEVCVDSLILITLLLIIKNAGFRGTIELLWTLCWFVFYQSTTTSKVYHNCCAKSAKFDAYLP